MPFCHLAAHLFTLRELEAGIKELKCVDLIGFKQEVFLNGSILLTQSLLYIVNSMKKIMSLPLEWSKMHIRTLKKKKAQ